MQKARLTTNARVCAAARPEKPEWLRIRDAASHCGLGRSKLYELIRSGKVKSVALRERGNVKPIRLVSYDSLMEWFEANTLSSSGTVYRIGAAGKRKAA